MATPNIKLTQLPSSRFSQYSIDSPPHFSHLLIQSSDPVLKTTHVIGDSVQFKTWNICRWFRPRRVQGFCSRHFEVAQNELSNGRDQHRHAGQLLRHSPYRQGARMVLQKCRMIWSPGLWVDLGNGSAGTTEEIPAYLDTPSHVKQVWHGVLRE